MPKNQTSAISNQTSAVSYQRSGLKWNGRGSIVEVPARDLTNAEVLEFGGYEKLIASGCYEAIDNEQPVERLVMRDSEE